ncbi:MAG: SDR family NAD(P)-dependent oxidoreductase, partial [Bacteroidales bacterium]|nr:SDR family NAD(P)-dependent oxidoreductase [Bacteroidales bacterium]
PEFEGDLGDWYTMIDTNIKGVLNMTRIIVPGMIERGRGHIINMGSVTGDAAYAGGNVYCATKSAVKAITDGLRIDVAHTPLRVTLIKPGLVETNFSRVRFHGDNERADNVYKGIEPLTAADIADIERNAAEVFAELQTEEDIPDFVMTVSADRFDSVYKTRSEVEPGWDSLLFNAQPGTSFAPRRVLKAYQMAKLMDVQMRSDSLHAAHILIAFGQNVQNRRDRDAARALADSLKQVLQAAPDRLAELAAAFSDDRSAAQNGGDLGWQKDGTFVKPFNQALIDGRVGDITVVETAFGFHVLRIIDKTAPVKKVLACVISMPVEPSIETAKDVYAQASRFLSQCKSGADFDSVARQNGMRVRTATRVDELADQMPGLNNAREIVRWAYNKDNNPGDVAQEVFEMENRYVVATLKKRHKEGY